MRRGADECHWRAARTKPRIEDESVDGRDVRGEDDVSHRESGVGGIGGGGTRRRSIKYPPVRDLSH
eukprot:scaffold3418_cov124-Isochrysis_galbana.AAC.5